jgi:nitroimidazol reductase NimA-like FMN-containing flavoprotein (pyridoxamine 5'-phosphate oxidase superfamily)
MSKSSSAALSKIRRTDRQISDEGWIISLLERAPMGYLATVHEEQPFLNSNLFVYDRENDCIWLHTARTGRTPTNLAGDGAKICFSVSEMGRLLPAATALNFSVEYSGVALFGVAEIVGEPALAAHGLQLLLNKYAPHLEPGRDYRPITPEELKQTAVIRLSITEWSGKQKVAPADFPGAFHYPVTPG